MPYLKIQTNAALDAATGRALIAAASRLVAEQLRKPEHYVMVALQPVAQMLFAGTDAPLAYLELKSIGLPGQLTTALSKSLCDLLHAVLAIPPDRIYIEFAAADPTHWGWNGGTF